MSTTTSSLLMLFPTSSSSSSPFSCWFCFYVVFGLIWCAQCTVLYQRLQSVLTVPHFGVCVYAHACACVCAGLWIVSLFVWLWMREFEHWFSRFVHDQSRLWVSDLVRCNRITFTFTSMLNAVFSSLHSPSVWFIDRRSYHTSHNFCLPSFVLNILCYLFLLCGCV